MKILIQNAILISMDDSRPNVEYGMDVLIEGEKISRISKKISTKDVDKIIDASGKVLMPGLINTHTHIAMSIFRETIDGLKLQDWLEKKIWPMEDKMTDDDVYYASLLSFVEMIKTGCSTANDMYFGTDSVIRAKDELGIRLQATIPLLSTAGVKDEEIRLKKFREMIFKYQNHDDTLSFNVGIHGLYTSNLAFVRKCILMAKELQLPVHIHFCEDANEVQTIKDAYHKDPVDVLVDEFADVPTILAHGVKLSNDDFIKMKPYDFSISSCPISNLKLGCGIPKVSQMLQNDILVSLGTDGQGSGSNLDMFEVMKFTALLQKGVEEDPMLLPAYDVLKMATINGAKTLKLDHVVGSIEVGKYADLILLNMDDVLLKPTNNILSQIVYNAKGYHVDTTIINGRVLMEKRILNIPYNEQELCEKCEFVIKRIF